MTLPGIGAANLQSGVPSLGETGIAGFEGVGRLPAHPLFAGRRGVERRCNAADSELVSAGCGSKHRSDGVGQRFLAQPNVCFDPMQPLPRYNFRPIQPIGQPLALHLRVILIFLAKVGVVEKDVDELVGIVRWRLLLETNASSPAKGLHFDPIDTIRPLSLQDSSEGRLEFLQGHIFQIRRLTFAFHPLRTLAQCPPSTKIGHWRLQAGCAVKEG